MEAKSLWAELKRNLLDHKKSGSVFQSWLNSIQPVNLEENSQEILFTLQIPSDLHKRWIQDNVIKDITSQITHRYQKPCGIRLKVTVPDLPVPFHLRKVQGVKKTNNVFFNSEYTFDSFIVGKNNEFAYGACLSITKQERRFNPLFICGPSGLGKTHLLNAIGQEVQKNTPKARILYLSAERFLNECIQSIQNRKMSSFQEKYRKNVDVLLMDDIQMIAKGCAVQEEFFHTFNELYHKQVQVVVCCDKFPNQIPNLEERIRTRLDGGLVVDISYPDMETKLAILRDKTNKKNLLLSESFLLKIASSCGKSVREMEGVLNRIKMMKDLHKGTFSSRHIEQILKSLTPQQCTPEEIQKKVAKSFSVCIEDLQGKSRTKNIVTARQTAMFLIKTLLRKSLNDVGRLFGGRDHTTVINSLKKVKKLQLQDPSFKKVLEDLHREIHNFSL
ncbi:MAG: chromosomal replication initiator protein DnaA [Bdellovibrionales bacterium]|nr:chromosomal replication initiator protein DnaA [Bdellovibrionales bacterium]